jgi:four helix bundle protein
MIDLRKHRTLKGSRPAGQKVGESARQRVGRPAGQRDGGPRKDAIRHHWELEVHKLAVDVAMRVFESSRHWPAEEKYSLTDQVRRSSRSVAANLAEGWRKRKYEAAFVSKLNDAEGEAAETQDWLMFAVRCGYLDRDAGVQLHRDCDRILAMLTKMGNHPAPWLLNRTSPKLPD